MSKVIEITNNEKVRLMRDSAWVSNANNWSKSRNLPNSLKNHIYKTILNQIINKDSLLVDLGCGSAWLLDYILKKNEIKFKYLGLDINSYFITHNKEKYKGIRHIKFKQTDLEKSQNLSKDFNSQSNLFIACLSFIEIIELDIAFKNVAEMMKDDECLTLIVLDPFFEIFRMSDDINAMESNLINFYNYKMSYYKKEIKLNNDLQFSSQYIGLLHKMEDYITKGANSGLNLTSTTTINCYNNDSKTGTIYKVLNFIKNDKAKH